MSIWQCVVAASNAAVHQQAAMSAEKMLNLAARQALLDEEAEALCLVTLGTTLVALQIC